MPQESFGDHDGSRLDPVSPVSGRSPTGSSKACTVSDGRAVISGESVSTAVRHRRHGLRSSISPSIEINSERAGPGCRSGIVVVHDVVGSTGTAREPGHVSTPSERSTTSRSSKRSSAPARTTERHVPGRDHPARSAQGRRSITSSAAATDPTGSSSPTRARYARRARSHSAGVATRARLGSFTFGRVQTPDFSRTWMPQADPNPMTWARPTLAPLI